MGNGHSAIGPSSAERWINCPASVPMSAKCPPSRPSEAAAEGSVAHKLAEWLVTGEKDELDLMSQLGEVVQRDGHGVEITEDMVDGARLYRDTVAADKFKLIEQNRPAAIVDKAETRVDLKSIDPDLWGTADYLLYQRGNRLIVYDYKYGKGKLVSPVENDQAGLYALGAMETEAGSVFDEVELVIVQPRAAGERVKRWVAPVEWLDKQRERARAAIVEARGPSPRIQAGDHCCWCPAQAVCPEIAKRTQAELQVDFAALAPTEPEVKAGELRGLPAVHALPVEKLAQILDWEDAIESFLGAVRQRVHNMLSGGQHVPGYKLVDGRSNRAWEDGTGEKAAAYFAPKFGHRVYAPKKPLSVAQMEKLVGKDKLPVEFVVKPEAAKKVAPSDDPRPVASSPACEEFPALPEPGAAEDPLAETPQPGDELLAEIKPKKIWA